MPRAVGVSPWRFSRWPRSCRKAAVTSSSPAPSASASRAACSECSSCVTPSPEYSMPPCSRKRRSMSASENPMALLHPRGEAAVGKIGARLVQAGAVAQAALAQLPGGLQDRVGGGAEEGVDAAQVADDVEVQRARLDRLHGLSGQPPQVRVVVGALEVAEALLLHQ